VECGWRIDFFLADKSGIKYARKSGIKYARMIEKFPIFRTLQPTLGPGPCGPSVGRGVPFKF
jgi:hypothetical protein